MSGDGDRTGRSAATTESRASGTPEREKPLILVVDGDRRAARHLASALERSFGAAGFRAAGVDDPARALELLSDLHRRGEATALVLLDQGLPGMTGIELLKEGCRLHPEARSTLLIRHADLNLALDAVNESLVDHFVVKPWDWERDVLPIVTDLLDTWQAMTGEREAEGITVVGERHSWHANRIRGFLDRNGIRFRWVGADCEDGVALIEGLSEEDRLRLPAVVFPDGPPAAQPSNVQIARRLGIATRPSQSSYDLVVIGGGPAGLAAAVYGSSEGLSTAVIEREAPGGQAGQSSRIENYLGFHYALPGAELTRRALIQARRFGAEIARPSAVVSLAAEGGDRIVQLSDHTTISAPSVIVATGVEYRRLRAPGVADLLGAGVYYGADPGTARDAVDQEVFIVGGANSAGQAAIHFAEYARTVTLLVRGDSLRRSMSAYLIEMIEARENIEVLLRTEVAEAHGTHHLEAISLTRDGERAAEPTPADALFIFIGAVPHTEWLGSLQRDERGFVLAGRDVIADGDRDPGWELDRDPYVLEASMPGVFAAGDVRHGSIKRVASAVGEGSMAVQLVHRYLAERS